MGAHALTTCCQQVQDYPYNLERLLTFARSLSQKLADVPFAPTDLQVQLRNSVRGWRFANGQTWDRLSCAFWWETGTNIDAKHPLATTMSLLLLDNVREYSWHEFPTRC